MQERHHRLSPGRAPLSHNRKCEKIWTHPADSLVKCAETRGVTSALTPAIRCYKALLQGEGTRLKDPVDWAALRARTRGGPKRKAPPGLKAVPCTSMFCNEGTTAKRQKYSGQLFWLDRKLPRKCRERKARMMVCCLAARMRYLRRLRRLL